jgi:PKD repeat protein
MKVPISGLNRNQKVGIALIFVSVMIFSGIGVMGFQALSHWNPDTGNVWSTYSPTAPSGIHIKSDYYICSVGSSASKTSLDTGISDTLTISTSTSSYEGSNENYCDYFYINGNQVATREYTGGCFGFSESISYTFSSTGSYSFTGKTVGLSDGYSGTSGTTTITVNPNPSVSISLSRSSADVGQGISLSASISGGTSPYSYRWSESGASGSFSSTTSSNPTWTPSGTGTASFSLTITDADGKTASASASASIDSDPSISVSSNKNPSDAGQTIDFSTAVSGGSGSYSSYSYVLYDGTSTSDSQLASGSSSSFSYSFSSSGSYLLKYSVTDSNGYTATSSLTQNVNTDPSVTVASSQNPTDSGRTVEFTSSVSGGTPGYSYSWSVDGDTYTSQDINVSFSSSGSYSVQLTVTDAADYSVSQSLTETVNSDPTVSASSNVSSADIDYPIEFSSTPSGGTGSYSYSWTLNGQQISTSQDFSYSFASSGSYTLTVTITDSVGVQSSASVTVTINLNPSVSVSSSQNPADVGNSVTFSSSESGGTGTDTYVWYINGVQESTASSFSYSFSAAGTYYVNVTVTDSDGHSASYSLKETVNPDPSVVINVVHNPTDVGIWANFSASISGGTGPFSYSWTINGESFTTAHVNYTFTASGTFPISLTVTDANGNTASASVNEVVNPDPTVAAEVQYSKVDQGINDTFYADVSGGTSPFNYTWSIGNTILNYSQEFHLNFSAIGTYDINLTVSDSLSERSSSSVSIKVIQKPSALIEGSNRTDVSTTTYWEGYGSYGTAPYNYYWFINGVNTSSGLYLEYSFPKTGSYNISLLIDDSQGSKAYAYLNVQVEPKPSVKISETISATDVGIPVHFSSAVAGGTPFFNYTWSVSGIGIVGYEANLTYIFSQPGSYNVSLYISDGSGNSASSSIGIRINTLPQARIVPEYSNIDPNVTDTFNSNITGGTPGFTFQWFVNGSFVGNASSITWSFSSAGIYPIRLVATDSQGISDSYSTDITVASYPNASIIASSTDLDANVSDQFRASGFGGIGPYGYEWIIAGHEFDNSTVSYAFRTPGNYSVQLIISDSFGKDASSSITVDVHPDPTVSVSWSGKPVVSVPFPLNANITGGITPYQISWIFPSGQHETGTSISHVFSSSGPDTFEVQVSDQGGYTETRNFTIDVGLYVAIAGNQTSGLGPLAVQFSSSVLGGSGYSYNWTFSPGHYSLQQNPIYQFPVGNYTVHFTVTSSNGATGQANLSIQSLPPPVSFDYSSGLNITQAFHFKAIPNWDAAGPYNMSWSFPNGQTITGMNTSYKFPVYNELNTVIATFSYGNGKIWTQYLTVRMIPAVPVVTFTPPSIIPEGTMLSLNATATAPDSSSFTYDWDINGTSESGQSVLYYFQNPGNYSISVTVTDSLGASASVHRTIEVLPQGTNSSIAISYTRNVVGPMDYYNVKVLSTSGIIAVEAFLGTTPLNISEINSTYTASGELAFFNLTMDQRDYPAGTYGISIVAFNNNSQSNHVTAEFQVTSQYSSSTFSLADVIAFFGGFSNFLITLLTVGGLVIAYASLRRQDNPDLIVQGLSPGGKSEKIVLKGKK